MKDEYLARYTGKGATHPWHSLKRPHVHQPGNSQNPILFSLFFFNGGFITFVCLIRPSTIDDSTPLRSQDARGGTTSSK